MTLIQICRLILLVCIPFLFSIQDIKTQQLSFLPLAASTVVSLGAGCYASIYSSPSFLPEYIVSVLLVTLIYFFVWMIFKGRLGTGDLIFAVFSSSFVMPVFVPVLLLFSVFPPLVVILHKRFSSERVTDAGKIRLPFIPFMSMGLWCTVVLEALLTF